MLTVKYNFADAGMASKLLYRGILCCCALIAILIYTLHTVGVNITSLHVTHDKTAGNLSAHLTKTTFKHIKELFYKIAREYRRQKKKYKLSERGSEATQDLCPFCPSDLFLLILVPSRFNSVHNRIAIRLTWAHMDNKSLERSETRNLAYQVVFAIKGQSRKRNSLTKEFKEFGDLLGPHNSREASKLTVIPAIKRLLAKKCKPKFLLVLRNDTFVNVPAVLSWLSKLSPSVVYSGRVKQGNNVHKYAPYCVDGAYLLAGEITESILNAKKAIPFSKLSGINEAKYIGILAYSLGIKPHNDARFKTRPFEDVNHRDINPCTLRKDFFVSQVFRISHILLYTKTLVVGKQPCIRPTTV